MKLSEIIPANEQLKIQELIDTHNTTNEFEVSLFSSQETSESLLTMEKFDNLISILTIVGERENVKPIYENTLDISFSIKLQSHINNKNNKNNNDNNGNNKHNNDNNNNNGNNKHNNDNNNNNGNNNNINFISYRITIYDIEQINEYLEMLHQRKNSLVFSVLIGFIFDKNNIAKNDKKKMTIMKKTKNVSSYITLPNVYARFKLDNEEQITKDEIQKLSNITKYFQENEYSIAYRFKERTTFSLTRNNNVFNIDLTRVRTSNKINAIETNNIKREIEIEPKIKDKKTLLPSLLNICEFIIKTIQESNTIITKTKSDLVISQYKNILNIKESSNELFSRKVVSLEVSHVVDMLPNKYAVTDKADGDHTQLLVMDNICYLISQNLVVKNTGLMVDSKFNGSILDGELIFIQKYNKYLFMVFDCLTIGNIPVKNEEKLMKRLEMSDELIDNINGDLINELIGGKKTIVNSKSSKSKESDNKTSKSKENNSKSSKSEESDNKTSKSNENNTKTSKSEESDNKTSKSKTTNNNISDGKFRYKELDLTKYDVANFDGKNGMLQYHKEQIISFYDDLDKTLNNKEINTLIVRRKYFIPINGVCDNEIFKYTSLLWNLFTYEQALKCPYHLDGLVMQPMSQAYVIDASLVRYYDYKWKPPTRNSIDLYSEFEKDSTGKMLICFDNTYEDSIKNRKFCIINLFVGQTTNNVEKPVPFNNEQSLSQSYVYLDDNDIPRSLDGKQIHDKTVVEYFYDSDLDKAIPYRWSAIETRYDKTESVQKYGQKYGNYITTAKKILSSIMNPVLMSDFDELSNDELFNKTFTKMRERIGSTYNMEEPYYAQKDKINETMRQFHNYIKSCLFYTYFNALYNNIQNNVLDLASGQAAAEIDKMYYCMAKSVVGVDIDINNIIESYARYKKYKMNGKKRNVPPMVFIQSNLAVEMVLESQERTLGNMTFENKQLFQQYFGVGNNIKYDRLDCQFALHYFFKNELTWKNFTDTLSQYSRPGSFFIATLFDGDLIKEKLKNANNYNEYYTVDGNKKLLFDIVKDYDDKNDDSMFGQTIKVHMGWISLDGVYLPEYIVKPSFLIEEMSKIDFELVETNNFESFYNNSEKFLKYSSENDGTENKKFYERIYKFYDKDDELINSSRNYSFLNRYYVFMKKEYDLNSEYEKYYKNNINNNMIPGKLATFDNKKHNGKFVKKPYHK